MEISTKLLPSGGYGYQFPTIRVNPLNFKQIVEYIESNPKDDPLGKYLYDVDYLKKDDRNIENCYIMDIDFLIFYKKLCTVSENLSYIVSISCPVCGHTIQKEISFDKDIHFKQIDPKIMNGARIKLNDNIYDTIVPTWKDFWKVFRVYMQYKKVQDLKMIKTISLIKDFDSRPSEVERDVLEATHSDITLLMALRDLYFDHLEPIPVFCPKCNEGLKPSERRSVAVGVNNLIVDFFRDLYINSPIDESKIVFK